MWATEKADKRGDWLAAAMVVGSDDLTAHCLAFQLAAVWAPMSAPPLAGQWDDKLVGYLALLKVS